MLRRTNFGMLVDDLGTSSEDEKALAELIKIAESVGMEIIENKTAISIKFCLEVMKRLVESRTTERIHLLNHIENLEERIKQIEQEPCKDMGRYDPYTDTFAKEDYISRQAAIKETLKYTMTSGVTNQGVWNECVQAIADTLANAECLPSVQPKVVPIAEIRFDDDKLHEIVDEAIKNIEIKPEWIPVSERLPRSHGVYQVTIQCEEGRYTSACYFDGSNTWHNDNRINHDRPYVTDKVIAWQEEPEPYKESEDL